MNGEGRGDLRSPKLPKSGNCQNLQPAAGLGIEKNRPDFCRDVLAIVTSHSSTILTRSWVELGTEREGLLQVLNENAYFRR